MTTAPVTRYDARRGTFGDLLGDLAAAAASAGAGAGAGGASGALDEVFLSSGGAHEAGFGGSRVRRRVRATAGTRSSHRPFRPVPPTNRPPTDLTFLSARLLSPLLLPAPHVTSAGRPAGPPPPGRAARAALRVPPLRLLGRLRRRVSASRPGSRAGPDTSKRGGARAACPGAARTPAARPPRACGHETGGRSAPRRRG